jgi:hypothetical protein
MTIEREMHATEKEAVKADVRSQMSRSHRQSVSRISKKLGIHVVTPTQLEEDLTVADRGGSGEGRVEQLIKTFLLEWVYVNAFHTSEERNRWLPHYLVILTAHVPHGYLSPQSSAVPPAAADC